MAKKILSILGLFLAMGMALAENNAFSDNVIVIRASTEGGGARSYLEQYISASLSGHYLSISVSQDIGQMTVGIVSSTGVTVDEQSVETPTSVQFYISQGGEYDIEITLSNGEEFTGSFIVMD
ncbi:MAG: DUF3244 domain-containing protein [Bacteroidales bacterium]|nr:DUF3244 domain-containing protein [Bacteroidales bacterium]MBR3427607.1 DUF3244 domain-containing protein [Bacteroidales bacterium]